MSEATGLVAAASSGDRLAALRELRDVLARAVVECDSSRDIGGLAGRLQSVLEEIHELTPAVEDEGTALDEFTRRRNASATGSARTARGK